MTTPTPTPTPTPTTRRLFIAVVPPIEARERLAGLVALLSAHASILRPAPAESLHFTLRFLGDCTMEQERAAMEACAAGVAGAAPFPLVIGGFGVFPNARRPCVVWLGTREGAGPLTALRGGIEDELLRRRVVRSREAFTPHLTLARVRPTASTAAGAALGAAVSSLPSAEQVRVTATAVVLVHSVLTPSGSRYTTLARWPLGSVTGARGAGRRDGAPGRCRRLWGG